MGAIKKLSCRESLIHVAVSRMVGAAVCPRFGLSIRVRLESSPAVVGRNSLLAGGDGRRRSLRGTEHNTTGQDRARATLVEVPSDILLRRVDVDMFVLGFLGVVYHGGAVLLGQTNKRSGAVQDGGRCWDRETGFRDANRGARNGCRAGCMRVNRETR